MRNRNGDCEGEDIERFFSIDLGYARDRTRAVGPQNVVRRSGGTLRIRSSIKPHHGTVYPMFFPRVID